MADKNLCREVAWLIKKYTEMGLTADEVAKDVIDVVIQRYVKMLADDGYYTARTKSPWPEEILAEADIERIRAAWRAWDPVREINERKQPQLRTVGEK